MWLPVLVLSVLSECQELAGGSVPVLGEGQLSGGSRNCVCRGGESMCKVVGVFSGVMSPPRAFR